MRLPCCRMIFLKKNFCKSIFYRTFAKFFAAKAVSIERTEKQNDRNIEKYIEL